MSIRELFRAKGLPVLQNRMYDSQDSARNSPRGDVVLVQDMRTALIYNEAFDESLVLYDASYQNEQACSPAFQAHLDAVCKVMRRCFTHKQLIEVGCGKGHFVRQLSDAGFAITGIDPAYEGDDPRIVKARFERGLQLNAEGVVLRHVLEHIPNPVAFLAEIARANSGRGDVYIEVPCFDWIRRRRAWFDVFYEHVNYFTLADFDRMFGVVHESGHLFGEQYLYVIADLATLREPKASTGDTIAFPSDFLDGIGALAARSTKAGRRAVWGGASKGVIFTLYMTSAGGAVDLVIDINPAKQGKFLPGSGLRVYSPHDAYVILAPRDDVFVMNSNYLKEIVAMSGNQYHYLTVDHHELR